MRCSTERPSHKVINQLLSDERTAGIVGRDIATQYTDWLDRQQHLPQAIPIK